MKFDMLILPMIPGTLGKRTALRPIGRNTLGYQQMKEGVLSAELKEADPAASGTKSEDPRWHPL